MAVDQIVLVRLGVEPGQFHRLPAGQEADALIAAPVVLHPETLAAGVHPLIGMRPVTVHVAVGGGDTPVAEQPGEHVGGLR